jgi:glycosyltransferase involved in cell wall biosynthesis
MKFIIYSAVSAKNISSYLGKPEYSYYFVLKKYLPIFEALGEITLVHSFSDIDVAASGLSPQDDYVICFSPPNKSYINSSIKVINIFAWEFDNLPYEVWGDDSRQNWPKVLSQHFAAVTLSTDSRQAVSRAMGSDYNVRSIPVPIWDEYQSLYDPHSLAVKSAVEIEVDGSIVESDCYYSNAATFDVDPYKLQIKRDICPNNVLLGFDVNSWPSGFLGGFYEPEEWGAWSKHASPWVLLPYKLQGRVKLSLIMNAYEANIGKALSVELGGESQTFIPSVDFQTYEFTFDLVEPALMIRFTGIDVAAIPGVADERSMGIGLKSLTISLEADRELIEVAPVRSCLKLSGVVYTTVFNPDDDRKNWQDIVKGFCYAFRNNRDVVLVLKITHHSLGAFLGRFHYLLSSLGAFSCRVVVVHGYLDGAEFSKLIDSTSYYINASKCEGLCMPLMEYMAAGKPAVATSNTAMGDYFSDKSGFVVESSQSPAIWPHDPRHLNRTVKYRINWMSLVQQLNSSYSVAISDVDSYSQMAKNATQAIRQFASFDVVLAEMTEFLGISPDETKALS